MPNCQANTKAGKPCRAQAGEGGFCFLHANPTYAKVLGQIGGRGNRSSSIIDLEVPDNVNALQLRVLTVQVIRRVLSGDVHAKEASALAQLFNLLHRVIPTADLETRLSDLEDEVGHWENKQALQHERVVALPQEMGMPDSGEEQESAPTASGLAEPSLSETSVLENDIDEARRSGRS